MVVSVPGDSSIKETKYNFNRKGGKSIIERRPVFSPDGESLAVIVENTIRVYNIQTGDCVRILETETHSDELIAIEFSDDEPHNLFGCSVNGCVTLWTWENGVVVREQTVQKPPDLVILTFNIINNNVCLLTLGSSAEKYLSLISYSIKTGLVETFYKNTKAVYYDMICVSLGWFDGDRFAAITNGTKMLFIQNLTQPYRYEQIVNHNNIRIMSVAAHNGTVAITDALGRVSVIRGTFFDNRVNKGREVLHWHFLPLLSCAFSLEGNHVYSGGLEKVLVKWRIGGASYKVQEKEFIPRLPGIIRFIATNNTHVAITLSNNSIVIADARLRILGTILECGGLSPVMRALGGTLIYHNRLGCLLMPGRTGHLQLYSTTTDKVLYNIDITQMNELPSERYNLIPIDTEVTCAAISANGSWLATSEYRNDGINYPEEKLKFWYAHLKGSTPFELSTCVNLSHGGCNVVALAFDNQGDYCVSAGTDHKFRIWKKEKDNNSKKKRYFVCVTACYYSSGLGHYLSHDILNGIKKHNVDTYEKNSYPYMRQIDEDDVIFKLANIHKEHNIIDSKILKSGMKEDSDSDMGGIAISQDGSLIAAWFGCKLTLWDSHLCNIRTTLAHPALRPKGLQVKFGSKDAAHYLVCTTENCLAVWSLLSLTIKWMVQIKPSCLAVDTQSNRMVVVTQENDVFVFTPHSPTPILTRKRVLNPETGVFKQITFGQSTGDDIRLFLMRNNSEIYSIEPEKTDDVPLEAVSWGNAPVSRFGAMLAARQSTAVRAATHGEVQPSNASEASGAVTQITTTHAHMMPPVSLLATSFLQQISGTHELENAEEQKDDVEEKMEVDQLPSSDDEDERPLNGPSPRVMELWTPNYEAVKQKKLNKMLKEPFLDSNSTSDLFCI